MNTIVHLSSQKKGELNKFLSQFYNANLELENSLTWEKNMPILSNWLKLLVRILIILKIFHYLCGFA